MFNHLSYLNKLISAKDNDFVKVLTVDENTKEREFKAFEKIADNYPKWLITMDRFDMSQNGIIHKNVFDFLLEE